MNIEDFVPVVKYHGLNTTKAIVGTSTLAITGASTLTGNVSMAGTLAVTGVTAFTAAPTGPTTRAVTEGAAAGATVVLTAAMSGGIFVNNASSGSPSWTMPTNTVGLTYTFVVANTTAGFTLTGGTFKAKANPAGAAITGTTLTNTQGTAAIGDTITFTGNGTNWLMTSQGGTFAAS